MERGLIIHNSMQLTIPLWLIPLLWHFFPRADLMLLSVAAVLGTLSPDIDHLNMWGKIKHKGFWDFARKCVQADRYRKAFLPFHHHIAIYIIGVLTVVFFFVDFIVMTFLLAFLVHLLFDYIADLFMIKQHTHWRMRNWFNVYDNNIRLPASQQVQQGHKQKNHA